MPATNRGVARLTPATTNIHGYFSSLVPPPECTYSWLGYLSVLCLIIWAVRRFTLWIKQAGHPHAAPLLVAAAAPKNSNPQSYLLGQGPWVMDEKARNGHRSLEQIDDQGAVTSVSGLETFATQQLDATTGTSSQQRSSMSRPPPAPPLTAPSLTDAGLHTLDQTSWPSVDMMYGANPDYSEVADSVDASAATSTSQSTASYDSKPRRRSYNKMVPIGSPAHSSPDVDGTAMAANSYTLPPSESRNQSHSPGSHEVQQEMELQGEILSVQDEDGSVWTRHTRVYGGGVCLACAAAGRDHHAGGFYGANVRPEEMHWSR